jgi:hypothetical protein
MTNATKTPEDTMNKARLETSKVAMCAATAWAQISIGVKMSCGARNVISGPHFLMFEVGRRTARKLTKVGITLDPSDTYTVERIVIDRKTYESKVEASVSGVYCDNLSAVVLDLGDR